MRISMDLLSKSKGNALRLDFGCFPKTFERKENGAMYGFPNHLLYIEVPCHCRRFLSTLAMLQEWVATVNLAAGGVRDQKHAEIIDVL